MNKPNDDTPAKRKAPAKPSAQPKAIKTTRRTVAKGSIPDGKSSSRRGPYKYDVCLSFAGEDRAYVSRVARCLKNRGVIVFYDMDEKAYLWGKNLVEHFGDLYEKKARYCVMFISEHYVKKLWTIFERRTAQARAFRSKKEYILPAYFDATRLPGLPRTVADVDLKKHRPLQLAKVIIDKLKLDQPDRDFKLPSAAKLSKQPTKLSPRRSQASRPKPTP